MKITIYNCTLSAGPPGPPVKGKNPNPLESRVAAVVKDDDPDPGASDGPQNVGKSGNWKGKKTKTKRGKETTIHPPSVQQQQQELSDMTWHYIWSIVNPFIIQVSK